MSAKIDGLRRIAGQKHLFRTRDWRLELPVGGGETHAERVRAWRRVCGKRDRVFPKGAGGAIPRENCGLAVFIRAIAIGVPVDRCIRQRCVVAVESAITVQVGEGGSRHRVLRRGGLRLEQEIDVMDVHRDRVAHISKRHRSRGHHTVAIGVVLAPQDFARFELLAVFEAVGTIGFHIVAIGRKEPVGRNQPLIIIVRHVLRGCAGVCQRLAAERIVDFNHPLLRRINVEVEVAVGARQELFRWGGL